MRVAIWSAVIFAVLLALYLGLAGQVDPIEVGVGVVCAGMGTALAYGLRRVAHRAFRLRPPFRALLRPLAALIPETLSVGVDLLGVILEGARGQRGAFVRQPFEPGGTDARSAGRRALAVIGVSLAPRGFVIRGDQAETMILHTMPPKPATRDARWPA